MAARSKAGVCGRSLAGIAGSNPTGGMDVLSVVRFVCCEVLVSTTGRSLVQRSVPSIYVSPSVIRCNCYYNHSHETIKPAYCDTTQRYEATIMRHAFETDEQQSTVKNEFYIN